MLRSTSVRALFVFVVLCLVSATRPSARPTYDDPAQARLDVAKALVELAAPRRDGDVRDRDSRGGDRALALAFPTLPFAVVPPLRTWFVLARLAVPCAVVPIVAARSSRGPPVG